MVEGDTSGVLMTKKELNMPIGFNLFSFDLYEAFRRRSQEADDDGDARNHSHQTTLSDDEEERRLRNETSDKLFWGFGYFPVP